MLARSEKLQRATFLARGDFDTTSHLLSAAQGAHQATAGGDTWARRVSAPEITCAACPAAPPSPNDRSDLADPTGGQCRALPVSGRRASVRRRRSEPRRSAAGSGVGTSGVERRRRAVFSAHLRPLHGTLTAPEQPPAARNAATPGDAACPAMSATRGR